MSKGSCGSKLDWGGDRRVDWGKCDTLAGEEGGESCGGADIEWRDFLVTLLRAVLRMGDGRVGDEDSAPD